MLGHIVKSGVYTLDMMVIGPVVKGDHIEYDGVHTDSRGEAVADEAPEKDKEWAERAKRLLKSQLVAKGVTYAQLAQKLGALGIHETEKNLNNKISRGGFTAAFFLQCMTAIGVETLRLEP